MIYTLLCRPENVFIRYLGEWILIRESDLAKFALNATVVDNKGIDTLKVRYHKPVQINSSTNPISIRV